MWFGRNGLGKPGLEIGYAAIGDHVTLALRPRARLRLGGDDLPVTGQPGERRGDLAERQGLVAAEVRVVFALEVVTVAGLALEEAERRNRNRHVGTIHRRYTP